MSEIDDLKSVFENMCDDQLIEVITVNKSDYTEIAFKFATQELRKRNLNLPNDNELLS